MLKFAAYLLLASKIVNRKTALKMVHTGHWTTVGKTILHSRAEKQSQSRWVSGGTIRWCEDWAGLMWGEGLKWRCSGRRREECGP